jgi:hypothetical protein
MSSTNRNIILGVVVLAILGLFIYIGQSQKKGLDWKETYKEDSKQPYGSFVIHEILKKYYPNQDFKDLKTPLSISLPNPDSTSILGNYIFIGDGFYADTIDIDRLLKFVKAGNKAFIASNALPNYLLEEVFQDSCFDDDEGAFNRFRYDWNDTVRFTFKHPQLLENKAFTYSKVVNGEIFSNDWSYIDTIRGECVEGAKDLTPLGYADDENINFARLDCGKGSVYIHTNPLAFTNYFMLEADKVRYASKAFSHLQAGIIYWDTKNRTSREVVQRMNGSNARMDKDSPLKYILQQPALRWAWFIFLGLIALYLIFAAKRRQRIIPVLEDKSNTSLDFIQTIGNMYFAQGEHIRLCDMMLKQFQTFVRERYHLASREMDETFMNTLATKSDVPQERIKRIVGFERRIYVNDITEDTMIEFHQLLNNFYKICK